MRTVLVAAVSAALIAGCGQSAPPATSNGSGGTPSVAASSPGPAASTIPAPSVFRGEFPFEGHDMSITCEGSGSPTVLFEAGLGSGGGAFAFEQDVVATTTRACIYDRAGLGGSRQRPGNPAVSAGAMAKETWSLLQAAGISGPLVLVGHSYGGMLARLVAHDHPEAVRGVVLVDASSTHQFEGDWLAGDDDWYDGGLVDRVTSGKELAAVTTLGDIPLVVLTQGQLAGQFEIDWSRFQDELARLSTDSLHVIAADSGHLIPADAPKLVEEVTNATVEAVRTGGRLPACGPRFETVGAECLKTTMTDQLAAWDVIRNAVVATAGTFPAGRYQAELTRDQAKAILGTSVDFLKQEYTWTFSKGHWTVSIVTDGGKPDETGDIYSDTGDEVTVRIPIDWKVPRTPGVNRLRWTADPNGTLHLVQIDGYRPETGFAEPLVRIGDAPTS